LGKHRNEPRTYDRRLFEIESHSDGERNSFKESEEKDKLFEVNPCSDLKINANDKYNKQEYSKIIFDAVLLRIRGNEGDGELREDNDFTMWNAIRLRMSKTNAELRRDPIFLEISMNLFSCGDESK